MRRSSFETLLYGYLPLVRYILDHQAAVEWSELRGQEVRFFPLSLRMSEHHSTLEQKYNNAKELGSSIYKSQSNLVCYYWVLGQISRRTSELLKRFVIL